MSKPDENKPLTFAGLMSDADPQDISKIIDPRATLIGIPFIIAEWEFMDSQTGPYVRVLCVTEADRKVSFVDGSTGIYTQAVQVRTRMDTPILVKRGLRVSEYEFNGTPTSTYYFA